MTKLKKAKSRKTQQTNRRTSSNNGDETSTLRKFSDHFKQWTFVEGLEDYLKMKEPNWLFRFFKRWSLKMLSNSNLEVLMDDARSELGIVDPEEVFQKHRSLFAAASFHIRIWQHLQAPHFEEMKKPVGLLELKILLQTSDNMYPACSDGRTSGGVNSKLRRHC